MASYVARAIAPRRFALTLLIAFAGLALLCTAVGLYGLVAFDVGRRTRDIGLRMAVGASREAVVYGILASGLRLGLMGVAGGLLLSVPVVWSLGDLLYGVGVADPSTWLTVALAVLATTLAATWLPARRASRLSPTAALRID
jgi:ABC-type antimicrobial peptide transport system permease subunit